MRQAIVISIIILSSAALAFADGMIIPRPMPWMPPNPTVNIKYHYVDVEINDPVALTKVDQVFVNPFGREIEADYIFPIPENAAISRFVAWLGGHKMEAELLDAAQARRIYEDIVRQRKDPALLEYAGKGMYRMRVYPIPANGEVRIQIEYEQTLKSDNGTVEYLYPLNTEKYSGSNLEKCKVDVRVNSFENIGALYCPTHTVTTERLSDKSMHAVYSEENVKPSKDLILYFTRQNRDFGFHLISYREPGHKDGFFLGILSPPLESRPLNVDKNMIFILDSSGSMRGEKFQQAIGALKFCLQGLNAGDRFNVIDYDDVVKPFKPGLVQATKANIAEAQSFADGLDASGGTNIYDALATGCNMISRDNDPTYIIFLTDGQPTVGNTNLDDIIRNTTGINENRARLFVFGVGYDVNAHLLDRLASENGGAPEYVSPDEDIESKISRLSSKISRPALTNLKLSFSPSDGSRIYPDPLPDLFYGSEIVITGRFKDNGNSNAMMTGKIGNRNVTYEFPVTFSDGSISNDFIALLWANRRIGYLLQEIRLHGSNDELLTEVIDLSKKYGIITEYTSFLVAGDERTRIADVVGSSNSVVHARGGAIEKKLFEQTGKSAVDQSQALSIQNTANFVAAPTITSPEGRKDQITTMTQVGAQAFFQSGSNWIQGGLSGDKYDMEVKRFSKAYFQILDKDPSLGRYLGLGQEVRLQIGSQVVQISDKGKEILTDKEINILFPN